MNIFENFTLSSGSPLPGNMTNTGRIQLSVATMQFPVTSKGVMHLNLIWHNADFSYCEILSGAESRQVKLWEAECSAPGGIRPEVVHSLLITA